MEEENKFKLFVGAVKAIEDILRKLNKELVSEDIEGKKKRCAVAIDFDNINSLLSASGKQFDFSGFINELLRLGFAIDSLRVFIPHISYHALPANINNLGYEIVVCQKLDVNYTSEKREDKVDSYMFMSLRNFLEYEEITHVIILTHDKHSIELLSEAVKKGKKVIYFGEKEKMNFRLVDVINQFDIPVFPVPSKEKRLY